MREPYLYGLEWIDAEPNKVDGQIANQQHGNGNWVPRYAKRRENNGREKSGADTILSRK
jgi:hypothetical protein